MSNEINTPAPAKLALALVEALLAAGVLIRAEFHRPGGPRGPIGKCSLDTQVEALLMDRLPSQHPCNWHGEELPRRSVGHVVTWLVDPKDGTSVFQRGLRGSSVSVALLWQGTPVLGVVYAPLAPDDAGDMSAWADGLMPVRNRQPIYPIGPRPAPS